MTKQTPPLQTQIQGILRLSRTGRGLAGPGFIVSEGHATKSLLQLYKAMAEDVMGVAGNIAPKASVAEVWEYNGKVEVLAAQRQRLNEQIGDV